ncbi:hypothetical protein [Mucilaginibacter sp.]|uniref:hypothetical protein n=1 Tax=Mucilaginibacter sp. TaxID=1882438 RepID=UPI003AFFC352
MDIDEKLDGDVIPRNDRFLRKILDTQLQKSKNPQIQFYWLKIDFSLLDSYKLIPLIKGCFAKSDDGYLIKMQRKN